MRDDTRPAASPSEAPAATPSSAEGTAAGRRDAPARRVLGLGSSDRRFVLAYQKQLLGERLTRAERKELRRRDLGDGAYRFANRRDRLPAPHLGRILAR